VTRPPWEYLFQAFSRTNFPDIYDAFWIASLVLLAVLVVLYNLRTRALHRHPPYLDLWEWLLWTGVITFMIVAIGATFLFDFFIVLFALRAGELLARFPTRTIEHVPRERNAEADRLANEGVDAWLASGGR